MKLRPHPRPFRHDLGSEGEAAAAEYLVQKGWKLLDQNFRCPIGEIDLIAEEDRRIIFVEVKTRTSERYGNPAEAVHKMKQRKIIRIAEWYLKARKWVDRPIRFDVLAITKKNESFEIRHVRHAFGKEDEF